MAEKEKNSNNTKLLIAISFLVLLFIILGVLLIKGEVFPASPKPSISASTLPLTLDNPLVANATVFYTLFGKIKDITSDKITLVEQGKPTPVFPLNENVKTALLEGGSTEKAIPRSDPEFKKGATVYLTVNYNYTTQSWSTLKIVLASNNNNGQ